MTPTELKEFRQRHGDSQRAMAKRLGVPLRSYEDWEGGRRRMPGLLPLACAALDVGIVHPDSTKTG